MRRLLSLVLMAVLVAPAPAAAVDPDEDRTDVPIVEGVPFELWRGHQDRATITVLDLKRASRAKGLGTAKPGRRWWLLRVTYVGRKGQPVSGQFDWYPEGGRFRVVRTGTRKRLPVRVLRRGRSVTGWMAWEGPSSPAGVAILVPSDDGLRYVLEP